MRNTTLFLVLVTQIILLSMMTVLLIKRESYDAALIPFAILCGECGVVWFKCIFKWN